MSWTQFCLGLNLSRTEFCLGLHTAVVFRMQSFNKLCCGVFANTMGRQIFCWPRSILMSHCYPLFRTSVDCHIGGFISARVLLRLSHNDLPGLFEYKRLYFILVRQIRITSEKSSKTSEILPYFILPLNVS